VRKRRVVECQDRGKRRTSSRTGEKKRRKEKEEEGDSGLFVLRWWRARHARQPP
jgi:hypothetical protein